MLNNEHETRVFVATIRLTSVLTTAHISTFVKATDVVTARLIAQEVANLYLLPKPLIGDPAEVTQADVLNVRPVDDGIAFSSGGTRWRIAQVVLELMVD